MRKLKIYRKFRSRTWDNTFVPEIRLEGKWLEQSGFKQGMHIRVEMEAGKITITPSPEKPNG